MKTIFADFNNAAADGTVRLSCSGSLDDIRKFAVLPGDIVTLTDGEVAVRAFVERSGGDWFASPEWDSLAYLDEQAVETGDPD